MQLCDKNFNNNSIRTGSNSRGDQAFPRGLLHGSCFGTQPLLFPKTDTSRVGISRNMCGFFVISATCHLLKADIRYTKKNAWCFKQIVCRSALILGVIPLNVFHSFISFLTQLHKMLRWFTIIFWLQFLYLKGILTYSAICHTKEIQHSNASPSKISKLPQSILNSHILFTLISWGIYKNSINRNCYQGEWFILFHKCVFHPTYFQ